MPDVGFGSKLQELRRLREWTKEDLAREMTALGVPVNESTVGLLETGAKAATVHQVWALASLLQVHYYELLPTVLMPLTHTGSGVTPGAEAGLVAKWHLEEAVNELKTAAALLHHEGESRPEHQDG